ncbi:hypothetical protein, partial [Pelomonas sp. Root1217]|uniref:hypothetical protein n=1 Tax=Pelomonas sp. Root1217 TaxID=1736430 RepID=UPI001F292EAF
FRSIVKYLAKISFQNSLQHPTNSPARLWAFQPSSTNPTTTTAVPDKRCVVISEALDCSTGI